MSDPVKLQIVFQGGGAKLVSLMAVCAALQKLQKDGVIQVTRVAGSSAGAITAVMLASGVTIETYKERLGRIAPPYIKATEVSVLRGGWSVVNGDAFFPKLDLQTFFHELFCKSSDLKTLTDVEKKIGVPVHIYSTNLVSMRAQQAQPDLPIPQALKSSCRFPLAFSGFKSDDMFVDGGLAMNLPVDHLKQDETTYGKVIGISFEEEYREDKVGGLLGYVMRLFSAAVQSGVARSEMMLRSENVFRVQTGIGTFDFKKALSDGLSREIFDGMQVRFETWLFAWLKKYGPVETSPQRHPNQRLIRPSETDRPWGAAVMSELDFRWRASRVTEARSIEMFDIAILDKNGDFTGLYRSICRKKFHIATATNILQFSCQIGPNGTFDQSNFGCAITDCNDAMLKFTPHVEEATKPGDKMRSFNVYFLFEEPLQPDTPNQPFYLDYQYDGDDPYPKLGQRPEVVSLTVNQGATQEIKIGLALPRSKFSGGKNPKVWDLKQCPTEKLEPDVYPKERWSTFTEMAHEIPGAELIREMGGLPFNSDSYVLVGRRGENIKQYQVVGIVVE